MVSLKTKNPFAGGVDVLKPKTWLGVGLFVVLAGVTLAGVMMIKSYHRKC